VLHPQGYFEMPAPEKLAKKQKYFDKLQDLCVNSHAALIVHVDHVTSKQMSDIRLELRGRATVLMGKNTMIRKALSIGHEQHPAAGMDVLRSMIKGNIGFIFATNCELDTINFIYFFFLISKTITSFRRRYK